jgi:hypothetical protein
MMLNATKIGQGLVIVGMFALVLGCGKQVPPTAPPTTTAEEEPAATQSADTDAETPAAGSSTEGAPEGQLDPSVQASLAALSAADRELAVKQKICPVSDAALGSMGTPIKLSVAGQDVFICCEGCEQPLKDEPDKYLAKIGLAPAEGAAVQ